MFAIREIPKKGKGLVATCDIDKGARILCEEPLLKLRGADKAVDIPGSPRFPNIVNHRVKALPFEKQQEFLDLYSLGGRVGYFKCSSIVNANALKLESSFPADHYIANGNAKKEGDKNVRDQPDTEAIGVFTIASRINHACHPNAHNAWNENIKRYTVHASRKIMEGEEITINYIGTLSMPGTLKEVLKQTFGFDCACDLCALPAPQPGAYDENVLKVHSRTEATLRDFTGACMLFGVPPVSLPGYGDCMRYIFNADMNKLLENIDWNGCIYKRYGMIAAFATSVSWAAKVCSLYGDLARASVFWQYAAHKWRILEGEDSPKFIYCKEQGQNPRRLSDNKGLEKWWSDADDIPEGLEYEDDKRVFAAWLWARPQGYLGPDVKAGLKAAVISEKHEDTGMKKGGSADFSEDKEIGMDVEGPLPGDPQL